MSRDLLFAEAALGKDAEEFLASDIGRYVMGRCIAEQQEAQDLLTRVSPWRRNRIRQLQNQAWRAQSVRGWIIELIQQGRQAEQALDNEDDD
jgi:hypothetical protein